MLELYDFMDGLDGFAGGMAVAAFGTLAILGSHRRRRTDRGSTRARNGHE
jgi:hypothetical protein